MPPTQDDWTALEPREIKRLLSHPELTYEQRTVFSLAIYTGLREGELAALLRTDIIDLDGPIRTSLSRRAGTTPQQRPARAAASRSSPQL
jgi:integrase